VGRDVESMVRDLIETSVRLIKEERMLEVKDKATENANKRIVELLVPTQKKSTNFKNPLEMIFGYLFLSATATALLASFCPMIN